MNLVVDLGNSFVKIAVFQEDDLVIKKIVAKTDLQKNLKEFLSDYPEIERSILSSVTESSFVLPEELLQREMLKLDSGTRLPFLNKYSTPDTLGNDRKALVAAASKYHEKDNVLIIDAGTCITYDFKNKANEYLGGAISPGLNMRFKALNTFTANLPLLEFSENEHLIGDGTEDSISSGVIIGIVKEIEGIIEEYDTHYQPLKIIFTGGDALFLSRRLKNGIFANSNFLLEGLNYILEFNKSQ